MGNSSLQFKGITLFLWWEEEKEVVNNTKYYSIYNVLLIKYSMKWSVELSGNRPPVLA